ncbi:hypothetical protein C4K46_01390 [Streptococcus oricebi]|uniref:Uncharacterized protein n=1 Tax=Streptococcus oricebi TaxID=1547447 RepID=A0ABS5B184_9STRE|nr:hypothetical protein [Streptococcus oricebi]
MSATLPSNFVIAKSFLIWKTFSRFIVASFKDENNENSENLSKESKWRVKGALNQASFSLFPFFFKGQKGRRATKNGIMVVYLTKKGLAMKLLYPDICHSLIKILVSGARGLVAAGPRVCDIGPKSLSFEKEPGLCF